MKYDSRMCVYVCELAYKSTHSRVNPQQPTVNKHYSFDGNIFKYECHLILGEFCSKKNVSRPFRNCFPYIFAQLREIKKTLCRQRLSENHKLGKQRTKHSNVCPKCDKFHICIRYDYNGWMRICVAPTVVIIHTLQNDMMILLSCVIWNKVDLHFMAWLIVWL